MGVDLEDTVTTGGGVAAVRPASGRAPTLRIAFAGRAFDGSTRIGVPDGGIVLGRDGLMAWGVPLDPRISRRHAAVFYRDGWHVRDLGSRNRTCLNRVEVTEPRALSPGDVIRLGDTLLQFCHARPAAAPASDPELVGDSPVMHAVREAAAAVAAHDNTVLITGETGAGKEVIARAIHRRSGRGGPFVALNCGGLAEGVLESELFGHVRGAFTGAVASHEGLLRAAGRGTLFLDEIGDMPAAVQVKLLRVLETRRVRPVGMAQELPVEARIVAATNRDVVGAVREGRFRADLYARLAQWLVQAPPLRERREDVPLLARHLLARAGAEDRPVEPALAEALLVHDWPLNVRGLANVLSIALIASSPGQPLGLHPQVTQVLAADRALAAAAADDADATASAPRRPLPPDAELESALDRHLGNVAQAARALGLSRQQVYRWLTARGLDPSRYRGGPA